MYVQSFAFGVDCVYHYTFVQWLLIFYIYCFFGWIFESCVVSIEQRKLINRGFLRGPMQPIYGFGALMMLHVSLPLSGHPVAIYFAGMVAATAFEYVVGVIMEAIFKVKYWDYSNKKFQFQGRICLTSSLAWGALSLLMVYVLHPPVEYLLEQFNALPLAFTVLVLSVYFVVDTVASVKAALDFAKLLQELDKMRADVTELREQFAQAAWEKREELSENAQKHIEQLAAAAEARKARHADAVQERREQFAADMAKLEAAAQEHKERRLEDAQERREQLTAAAEQTRLQMYLAIQEAEAQMNEKIHSMKPSRKWLVRGNPSLRSKNFNETLEEIKKKLAK